MTGNKVTVGVETGDTVDAGQTIARIAVTGTVQVKGNDLLVVLS